MKSLRMHNEDKGMTLVEVLVAMVILLILVVAFTSFIGWNFTSIFIMGEKSKAIASAMEKTDQLYALVWNAGDPTTAEYLLKNPEMGWKEAYEDIFDGTDGIPEYYYEKRTVEVEDGSYISYEEGFEVTVVVSYREGMHHVELESFIKEPETS